jgi:hypothetical protein
MILHPRRVARHPIDFASNGFVDRERSSGAVVTSATEWQETTRFAATKSNIQFSGAGGLPAYISFTHSAFQPIIVELPHVEQLGRSRFRIGDWRREHRRPPKLKDHTRAK